MLTVRFSIHCRNLQFLAAWMFRVYAGIVPDILNSFVEEAVIMEKPVHWLEAKPLDWFLYGGSLLHKGVNEVFPLYPESFTVQRINKRLLQGLCI